MGCALQTSAADNTNLLCHLGRSHPRGPVKKNSPHLEGREAMGGKDRPRVPDLYMAEIFVGHQDDVGAHLMQSTAKTTTTTTQRR